MCCLSLYPIVYCIACVILWSGGWSQARAPSLSDRQAEAGWINGCDTFAWLLCFCQRDGGWAALRLFILCSGTDTSGAPPRTAAVYAILVFLGSGSLRKHCLLACGAGNAAWSCGYIATWPGVPFLGRPTFPWGRSRPVATNNALRAKESLCGLAVLRLTKF